MGSNMSLLRLGLIFTATGAALGVLNAALTQRPLQTTGHSLALPAADSAGHTISETRYHDEWQVVEKNGEDGPIYATIKRKVPYVVYKKVWQTSTGGPSSTTPQRSRPFWDIGISSALGYDDWKTAFSIAESTSIPSDRNDAFEKLMDFTLSGVPTIFSGPVGNEPTPEAELQHQLEMKAFVDTARARLTDIKAVADRTNDSDEKAVLLAKLAKWYMTLGQKAEADSAFGEAVAVHKRVNTPSWKDNVNQFVSTAIKWAATLGFGSILSGLFVKVAGFYIAESLAQRLGDEKVAKALGVTLREAGKVSGLILPASVNQD